MASYPPYEGPERRAPRQQGDKPNVFHPEDLNILRPFRARTDKQSEAMATMRKNRITLLRGPAGTAKTFLAAAMALEFFLKPKDTRCEKIIISRANVEADEDGKGVGYLPGDVDAKVYPFARPFLDNMAKIIGPEQVDSLRSPMMNRLIEMMSLTHLRGLSPDRTFIVLDEGQNATSKQLKLVLTRLGQGSRIVVTADPEQCDLPDKDKPKSAIHDFDFLAKAPGIGLVDFDISDVERDPLVKIVLEAYRNAGK